VVCLSVEGRGDYLTETARLHLRHLLGSFINEEDVELAFGVIGDDPFGHRL